VRRRCFGEGGLFSYLGTRDGAEAVRRAAAGDPTARAALEAMAYQIAKAVAEMAAVLLGRVDAVLVTGGMAHAEALVADLRRRVGWIAPVVLHPGEDELQALAEGALRALAGAEPVLAYG
jgi:butyrate kinase